MKTILAGLLAFAAVAPAAQAAGFVDEVRVGASIQSAGPIASNLERGAAVAGEVFFASPRLFSVIGKPRPVIGLSVATDEAATSFAHAGLGWRASLPVSRLFLDLGLGVAVHDGRVSFDPAVDLPRDDNAFLGCPVQFRLSGGPGVRVAPRVTAALQWEHLSNAGICDENEGLDNIGVRLGVSF